MTKTEVRADAIRGIGQIESMTIASVVNANTASAALFCQQLAKPLTNDEIELMLSNQSILLNAIGNRQITLSADLAQLASGEKARDASDRYLKNGFKALELSRKCLTALNEVRNPKRSATFVKQQLNQINLGDQHGGATVDRIAESKTESFNPNMATVATEYRCENSRG
jgi:hypothetical protein